MIENIEGLMLPDLSSRTNKKMIIQDADTEEIGIQTITEMPFIEDHDTLYGLGSTIAHTNQLRWYESIHTSDRGLRIGDPSNMTNTNGLPYRSIVAESTITSGDY